MKATVPIDGVDYNFAWPDVAHSMRLRKWFIRVWWVAMTTTVLLSIAALLHLTFGWHEETRWYVNLLVPWQPTHTTTYWVAGKTCDIMKPSMRSLGSSVGTWGACALSRYYRIAAWMPLADHVASLCVWASIALWVIVPLSRLYLPQVDMVATVFSEAVLGCKVARHNAKVATGPVTQGLVALVRAYVLRTHSAMRDQVRPDWATSLAAFEQACRLLVDMRRAARDALNGVPQGKLPSDPLGINAMAYQIPLSSMRDVDLNAVATIATALATVPDDMELLTRKMTMSHAATRRAKAWRELCVQQGNG